MTSQPEIISDSADEAIIATASSGRQNDSLEAVVADTVRIGGYQQIPDGDGPHLAVALVHRMIMALTDRERAGWSRDRILSQLQPARIVYAESPFVKRLQEWPRGYPGDFETVEYILQQRNRATPGRLSFWLEQYALDSSIASSIATRSTCRRERSSTRCCVPRQRETARVCWCLPPAAVQIFARFSRF